MSVFEKHKAFIQLLQKGVVQKDSSKRKKAKFQNKTFKWSWSVNLMNSSVH